MLTITSVSGNIFHDRKYESLEDYERLLVSRPDLEKNRMRKKTDRGTDVGFVLEPGKSLRHGDVLSTGGKTIVIEQMPEKVVSVKLKNNKNESLVLVGHIIGNRHRPIAIKNGTVCFPVLTDSELGVFERLFSDIIDDVELSIEEEVFTPHRGADVHGHN